MPPHKIKDLKSIAFVQEMLKAVGVPGDCNIKIIRKCVGYPPPGVGLLRVRKNGKIAVIVKNPQGEAKLCTIDSDTLSPRDLRLLISSRLIGDFYPIVSEIPPPDIVSLMSRLELSLLDELILLEQKFKVDTSQLVVPSCVARLRKVRQWAARLDEHIAKAKAARKKLQNIEIAALMARDRADKIARKGLEFARGIDSL